MFAKYLLRQPSREDIGVSSWYSRISFYYIFSPQRSIVKVLGQDAQNRQGFNKAKSVCYNRLTDLRCEERRRVSLQLQTCMLATILGCFGKIFGNKPCDIYPLKNLLIDLCLL